ncbi:MAG: hypothetical protein ACFE0Q_11730 [Anaerolineae bacterium]
MAWHNGLFLSFSHIADMMAEGEPLLYDPPLVESAIYKNEAIRARQPDVILLGSSRILGFREEFCHQHPQQFYNAGIRTLDISSMDYYGRMYIDTASPDVLILALDQPSFNADYRRFWPDIISFTTAHPLVQNYRNIYNLLRASLTMTHADRLRLLRREDPVFGVRTIGLNAVRAGIGYRNDGSYQFGIAESEVDRNRIMRMFGVPNAVYLPGDMVSDDALTQLETLLNYADSNDVDVIGFFPPFAPDTYQRYFGSQSDAYRYLSQASTQIMQLFETYNFSFYDMTDPNTLGITDDMMLDSWHLSERSALLVYLALLEQENQALGACSDADDLQQPLLASEHPFQLFRPDQVD